jgi:hypothetical protein
MSKDQGSNVVVRTEPTDQDSVLSRIGRVCTVNGVSCVFTVPAAGELLAATAITSAVEDGVINSMLFSWFWFET